MAGYFVKRLLILLLTLFVASVAIFVAIELVPGDPAAFMLGINAQPDTLAALRTELGLDATPVSRYFSWLGGMLVGDFGTSYTYRTPVSQMIVDRLSLSLPLTVFAFSLSLVIAFPVGFFAAKHRGKLIDFALMSGAQLGVAVPNFWVAMLLVLILAVQVSIFPAGGFPGWDAGFIEAMRSLVLPAVALALPQGAVLARVLRSSLVDTMHESFIITARAKGLSEGQALWRHGLRNALIPVVTLMGLSFSYLLAGAIVIEQVFYLPGIGRLIFQAISQRDLIVVESTVMVVVFGVILVAFFVDLFYAVIDPRVRLR